MVCFSACHSKINVPWLYSHGWKGLRWETGQSLHKTPSRSWFHPTLKSHCSLFSTEKTESQSEGGFEVCFSILIHLSTARDDTCPYPARGWGHWTWSWCTTSVQKWCNFACSEVWNIYGRCASESLWCTWAIRVGNFGGMGKVDCRPLKQVRPTNLFLLFNMQPFFINCRVATEIDKILNVSLVLRAWKDQQNRPAPPQFHWQEVFKAIALLPSRQLMIWVLDVNIFMWIIFYVIGSLWIRSHWNPQTLHCVLAIC